jgi:hypothetical protein
VTARPDGTGLILESQPKSIPAADALGAGRADHRRMSLPGVAVLLLLIVVINVLPRVVGLPDLPAVSLPEVPDWLRWVLRAKSLLVAAAVAVLVGAALVSRGRAA